jgi:hypothetical protein
MGIVDSHFGVVMGWGHFNHVECHDFHAWCDDAKHLEEVGLNVQLVINGHGAPYGTSSHLRLW